MRAPLDLLFLVCCIALTADVLVPEIWGGGKTKDYPLWFWAGRQVLQGGDLYPSDPTAYFEFIYPPLSAVLLAVPSFLGKIPFYLCLSLLNVVAWWMTAQFSHAMTGSGHKPGPWLQALPGFVTVTFVFDMFDLGQPNLVLLALMLYGFWLLRRSARRGWRAACSRSPPPSRCFPVAVFPYLVWRRQWAAAAEHAGLSRRVPVRAAGAVSRLPAQCRGAEDLVPGHGGVEFGEGVLASATSRTGPGSISRSSR